MSLGELAQHFGSRSNVVVDKRNRGGTFQQDVQPGMLGLRCCALDQRVLVDLVLGSGARKRSAQRREVGDFQSPVLGEDGGIRVREVLTYLFNCGDFLGSWPSHLCSLRFVPVTARRERNEALKLRLVGRVKLDPFSTAVHRISLATFIVPT